MSIWKKIRPLLAQQKGKSDLKTALKAEEKRQKKVVNAIREQLKKEE